MSTRTASPGPQAETESLLDAPFRLVVALAGVMLALVVVVAVQSALAPSGSVPAAPSPSPTTNLDSLFYPASKAAQELALTDQDGRPFSLASLRGAPVFVFFGYTHCPDVCPATMGILGQVLTSTQTGLRVVFVTVDPERDTVPWLKEYVRYLPSGVTAVTGTAAEIRAAADAWGVRYAKVATNDPKVYSMSHTADVYVVDATGALRARLPFGTQADAMTAVLDRVVATTPAATPDGASQSPTPSNPPTSSPEPSGSPTAGPSGAPVGGLRVEVVSSSIWSGPASPVILRLSGPEGPLGDASAAVTVQVRGQYGDPIGAPVTATAVRPEGVPTVSWVAALTFPDTGWWDLAVSYATAGGVRTGRTSASVGDPGSTAVLGGQAPTARTPTLDDVSGRALAITTDPIPDLRLSRLSTADALAQGRAFVLVIDSVRFKVTPVCGKAVGVAKYLLDRWPDQTFIHLEPYRYSIVTDTAVLDGSLSAPTLVPAAEAWGIGEPPWGAGSMPWVFIVDRHGVVRAKYQGIVGSDDIDVILTLLAAEG